MNQNRDKCEELKSLSKEYVFADSGKKKLEPIYIEYDGRINQVYLPLPQCYETG